MIFCDICEGKLEELQEMESTQPKRVESFSVSCDICSRVRASGIVCGEEFLSTLTFKEVQIANVRDEVERYKEEIDAIDNPPEGSGVG